MKRFLCLAALWAGCASQPASRSTAASPAADSVRVDTAKILDGLEDLEIVVKKHDKKGLLSILDPDYRSREHDDRFQGNTDQFVNEVFCGPVLYSDQQYCLVFDEILDFKRVYFEAKPGSVDAAYDVKTKEREIRIHMKSALSRSGRLVGFIGPKGITQVEIRNK